MLYLFIFYKNAITDYWNAMTEFKKSLNGQDRRIYF